LVVRQTTLTTTRPIVDSTGTPNQEMRSWSLQVDLSIKILGEGSPEGVVEAEQWQEYVDTNGTTGSFKYIKAQESVLGDRTKGWILL